jgi:hypothetical protein
MNLVNTESGNLPAGAKLSAKAQILFRFPRLLVGRGFRGLGDWGCFSDRLFSDWLFGAGRATG